MDAERWLLLEEEDVLAGRWHDPSLGTELLRLLQELAVEDERSAALQAIRWEVASKFDPVQGPFNVGPRLRVGEPHIRDGDLGAFAEAHRRGGKDGLMAAVPEHYVANLTASGTPAEAKERVQQYRDAGVKLPVLRPGAEHQTQRVLDLFAPNG